MVKGNPFRGGEEPVYFCWIGPAFKSSSAKNASYVLNIKKTNYKLTSERSSLP